MKQIYSDVITFRGSYYEFGLYQGERLRDSLIIHNRKKQKRIRKPRFSIDVQEAKHWITAFSEGVWEELIGLQDSLKWPMEEVLQEFGGYRLDYVRSGCSIMIGDDYFVRNYDYMPKTYEGRYVLYQPDSQGMATVGPSQRITGRMDGMNETGLVIGYNFTHRKKPADGFICCMIARLVLESSRNCEEAIERLREIPHRHSFSYIIFDRTGASYVVEAAPRGTEVRTADLCTNHFEIMTEENRHHLDDSYKRMEVLKRSQPYILSAKDAFHLLNDTDRGIFSKQYRNWAGTIHTSAYFPGTLKAWFALGGDAEPHEIDFEEWIGGKELSIERFYGSVDTDIPFAHMDEKAY
ncbi:MAG: acyl-CoA--6-aminopenicillanic acid acyltransferase [Bacillaceae bacterium]|nr:acyl-CoA--6-aminopenicillanic acid acyltransferase [Bacillaceae bacterium]